MFFGWAGAIFAIALDELLSRGRVLYPRLPSLIFLFSLFGVGLVTINYQSPSVQNSICLWIIQYFLSGMIAIGAWFGFRVHLSNSITLQMLDLIDRGSAQLDSLARAYNKEDKIKKRIEILL